MTDLFRAFPSIPIRCISECRRGDHQSKGAGEAMISPSDVIRSVSMVEERTNTPAVILFHTCASLSGTRWAVHRSTMIISENTCTEFDLARSNHRHSCRVSVRDKRQRGGEIHLPIDRYPRQPCWGGSYSGTIYELWVFQPLRVQPGRMCCRVRQIRTC